MSSNFRINDKDVAAGVFAVACLGIIAFFPILLFAGAAVAMYFWNMVISPTFDIGTISYWQAFWGWFGILFISSLVSRK